jgi:hypothetical protein
MDISILTRGLRFCDIGDKLKLDRRARQANISLPADPAHFIFPSNMPTASNPEDAKKPEWTMSEEREMLEKIVYHRFNFFMVLITVITTSILRAESMSGLKLALGTGMGLSILFFYSLWKNQRRLNAALKFLVKTPEHPVAILDEFLGPESAKGVIGYTIPLICIIILLMGNILVWVLPPGWYH